MTLASQGIRFLLQTGRAIVLAWLVAPHDYGLIAMVGSVSGILGMFRDPGLAMATIMTPEVSHRQVSSLFWLNAALGTACALTLAAAGPLLAWFYGEPDLAGIALAHSSMLLISGFLVQHQALLRRQMRFGALAVLEIGALAVGTAVGIASAYRGAGYWALVAMEVSTVLTSALVAWTACRWRPSFPIRGTRVRGLLRFGGQLTAFSFFDYCTTIVDAVLLGWRWGPTPVGLYTKASNLLMLPVQQIGNPISAVAIPVLSRLVDDPEAYRRAYVRILEQLALVTMPGVILMVGCAEILIPLVLGPQWIEAAPIFAVLGLAGVVRPVLQSGAWVFMTQGRAGSLVLVSVVHLFAYLLAVSVSLRFGALGVGVGIAVATWLLVPAVFWYASRSGPVRLRDFVRAIRAPLLAAAVELGALLLVAQEDSGLPPLLALGLRAAVAGATALATLAVLPSGRAALLGLLNSLRLLRDRRAVG